MPKDKFLCPAKFEKDGKGYLTPIYPQNPSPELRAYIMDKSARTSGLQISEMSLQQIWLSNAAQRILTTERLAKEQLDRPRAEAESRDPAYKSFRAKLAMEV